MRIHFKIAAALAMLLVVILASTSFLFFAMMAHPNLDARSVPDPFPPPAQSFSAAGTTLLVAYIVGAWAWILMFAMQRSGVQRLERVLSHVEES